MKKVIFTWLTIVLSNVILVQSSRADIGVSVTGNSHTTPALLTSYPSLALALADLNAVTAMSGPVTLILDAGTSETTPPAGLTIGSATLNPALSSVNKVTIVKAAGTVTLNAGVGTATPASPVPDGILKIVGADYITIDGLTFTDGNTTNPQTMEFGVGLFKASLSDGAQNCTIINCTFIMQRINNALGTSPMFDGSSGILAINATPAAATTALVPVAPAGTNSYNKIYANTFNGGNNGIALSGFAAATPFVAGDTGNDIGGTSAETGNTILNFGGAPSGTPPANGIRANHQWGINISYNNINNNDGSGVNHGSFLRGIYAQSGTSANVTISFNHLTLSSGSIINSLEAINNGIGSTAANNTVSITGNTVENCTYATGSTGEFLGIYNNATAATVNISGNTVKNNTLHGSGSLTGIQTGNCTVLNFFNNNVFGNTSVSPGNSTNTTMYCTRAATSVINMHDNIIHSNNIISTGGSLFCSIYGYYNFFSPSAENYSNNQIYDLNITGPNSSTTSAIYGLFSLISGSGVKNISLNTIYGLNLSTAGSGAVYGIYNQSGASVNISRNKVCSLSATGAGSAVHGIYMVSGVTTNITNNLIGNLSAPNSNAATPLAGINIAGGTTHNLYYNTVYLDATSTGALFGSAAVYASTTPTVNLRNNILVNISTPNGVGITAAYMRSSGSLASYASTSNNNYFYAGSPVANRVVFYDGTTAYSTLASYQALVSPRDNFSGTDDMGPSFQSTNCPDAGFLHLNPSVQSFIESGGFPIPAYENDIDGDIRQGSAGFPSQVNGGGSAPDIGADEHDGIPVYTCIAPVPGATLTTANNLCQGQSITLSLQNATDGRVVTYQWQSSVDGLTYSNITGANNATYTTIPVASLYYKCIVTCHNGPASATSTPVQITFINNILSTAPGIRCGIGTVTLGATASAGTINWYSSLIGGTQLGTGPAFTTPVIGNTTSYFAATNTTSPGNVTQGAGDLISDGYQGPFNYFNGGEKSQYLIRASELSAAGLVAGNITAISFDVASSTGTSFNSFTLSIGNTTLTAMTSTLQGGLTSVFSSGAITPVTGIFTITFTDPFTWDGATNLIIQTCWSNNNAGSSANSAHVKYSATSFTATAYYRANNAIPAALCFPSVGTGTFNSRPKMIFAGTAVCSSPRSEVIATVTPAPPIVASASPASICASTASTLTVTSANPDYVYSWTPGNLSGASQTVFPEASTTYTVTANDAGTGCVAIAVIPVTVVYSPLPVVISPVAPLVSPGEIQQLTATGGEVVNVTLLNDHFNGANSWTTLNNSTSGTPANAAWTLRADGYIYSSVTFRSNDTSQFYMTNSAAQGSGGVTSTQLISPLINTAGYSSLMLSFWHYYRFRGVSSQAKVEVSTDGGVSWNPTPLASYGSNQGGPAAFVQVNINLSSYIGQPNLKIRFRYQDNVGWYWCIDNVSITGTTIPNLTWSPFTDLYSDQLAVTPYNGEVRTTVYSKPVSTITYTASASAAMTGCVRTKTVTVTLAGVPVNLTATGSVGEGQSQCYNATETIIVGGTPSFTVVNTGSATFIAGLKINFMPGTTVQPGTAINSGGYLHAYISNVFCPPADIPMVAAGIGGEEMPADLSNAIFSIYPNPAASNFTLVQKGENAYGKVEVDIYNMKGIRVMTGQMIGEQQHQFSISALPPGVYFVKIVAEGYVETIKLVRTR